MVLGSYIDMPQHSTCEYLMDLLSNANEKDVMTKTAEDKNLKDFFLALLELRALAEFSDFLRGQELNNDSDIGTFELGDHVEDNKVQKDIQRKFDKELKQIRERLHGSSESLCLTKHTSPALYLIASSRSFTVGFVYYSFASH